MKNRRHANGANSVFKAPADPGRRKLLDLLHARNGRTLAELCEPMDMARQSVTQHLALLEAANLVTTKWRGREKLHYLNVVPLQEIYNRWIRKFGRPLRTRAVRDTRWGALSPKRAPGGVS